MVYFMFFITNVGSPISLYLLSLALIGLLWVHHKKKDARDFFYVMSISAILVVIIKEIVHRQRPPVTFYSEIGYSFPSAHALLALIFFFCIALFYESHFKSRILKNIFISSNLVMVLLISYSRVYLGVHYWSDVLGSLIIGSIIFLSYYAIRHKRHKHPHIIIGITGTNGSGKGTVVEILRKKKHFHYFSVRGFITPLVEKKGWPVDRPHMQKLSDELRKNFCPSYITDQLIGQAFKRGDRAIIESFRAIGEVTSAREIAKKLHAKFVLLAVHSETNNRYERIQKRGSATDNVSLEEFIEHDKMEADLKENHRANIHTCVKMADYTLENNGSFEELEEKVDEFLKTLA